MLRARCCDPYRVYDYGGELLYQGWHDGAGALVAAASNSRPLPGCSAASHTASGADPARRLRRPARLRRA